MTAKESRAYAGQLAEEIRNGGWACYQELASEILGIVAAYANGEPLCDTVYARRLADTLENIVWLKEYREQKITWEEFSQRLFDKGKAKAQKEWDARMKRMEAAIHPKRKRRK